MLPLAVPRRRVVPLAAVVGAAAALLAACAAQSQDRDTGSGAAARPSSTASVGHPGRNPGPVPPALLRTALGCPHGMAAAVGHRVVLPGTVPAVVVAAHCASGAGSPPWGVYVVADAGSGLRLTATLVAPRADVQVNQLTVTGSSVRVVGGTYSSAAVPRCCPDRAFSRSWTVTGGRLAGSGP